MKVSYTHPPLLVLDQSYTSIHKLPDDKNRTPTVVQSGGGGWGVCGRYPSLGFSLRWNIFIFEMDIL